MTKLPRGMAATSRLCALWVAIWILLLLPDFLLYFSGYSVEAAVKLKALVIAAIIAFLVTTVKSRRFRMEAAQTVARALGVRLETTNIPEHRFYLNCTMPFALAGFMEVEQQKPGVYDVKTFARNGQLLSQEVTNLPEAAAANVVYATARTTATPRPSSWHRRRTMSMGLNDQLASSPTSDWT
jgi:hypothetical protein